MFIPTVCKFAVLDTKTIYLDKHLNWHFSAIQVQVVFAIPCQKVHDMLPQSYLRFSFLQSLLITSFDQPELGAGRAPPAEVLQM